MNEWGNFELEKKGADWRVSARGVPAVLLALCLVGIATFYLVTP